MDCCLPAQIRHLCLTAWTQTAGRPQGRMQEGNNPFGDYAPQSTQIQGILKGMYDAFTAELEKDNAAEAESQKSFEELMATKAKEKATLEGSLEKQETDKASKEKSLAQAEVLLDDTTNDLNA